MASSLFVPTDDQERKERILEGMVSAPQHVVVFGLEGLRDYDTAEATGGLAVPAVYIAADEAKPRSDMARFHELTPRSYCTARPWDRGTSVGSRCRSRSTR